MPAKNKLNLKDVLFCAGDYRTKLVKITDYYIGGLVCALFRLRYKQVDFQKDKVSKILIIRPGGIGDAVLLIPFLKEIRSIFIGAKIDILAEKRNVEVFRLASDLFDEMFCYDSANFISIFMDLKMRNYDLVFDTEQWHNFSAILSYYICSKIRVGFATRPNRARFYTNSANYSQRDYEVDSFINLLGPWLLNRDKRRAEAPFLTLSDELISWARSFIPLNCNSVALSLSASIKQRIWSVNKLQALTNYLIRRNYKVIFLGGAKEIKLFNAILKGVIKKEGILDFVNKINLSQVAVLMSVSKFYFGSDSGILHIAYGLAVPSICLFGSGNIDKWAPPGNQHITISMNLLCSPCTLFGYTPDCRDVKCMEEIKVEDVIAAIERLEKIIQ